MVAGRCLLNVHSGKILISPRISMFSHHVACQETENGLQIQLVASRLFGVFLSVPHLLHQVINDFLCQFSCLRISTELGASKVSRWKMAKACCPHFARSLLHSLLKRHVSSLNVLVCAIVLCSHAACKNFAGLFAVRFVLGICEGSITAGFMIVSSMFYTRREHTARVGYWCE